MRRNSLNGIADTLMAMAVSQGSEDLYLAVADRPDGVLVVDVLARTGALNGHVLSSNPAIVRIADWLQSTASRVRAVTYASLQEVTLRLALDSTSIPTAREHLLHYAISPSAVIRTNTRTVAATGFQSHLWIHRRPRS